MERITVELPANSYDICIENGLFARMGGLLRRQTAGSKALVVTDATVDVLYGKTLVESGMAAGLQVTKIVIPTGEASKSLAMLGELYRGFADAGLTRGDLVIAFGGGVVGDLAGFAAATYLRGIPYVQIPTTLLAQIDSSVGGKTAINLPQGKNLAGAFYQPAAVLIDPAFLDSLPPRVLRDGMAEAVKYGAIADRDLFEQLAGYRSREDFLRQAERVIAICCRIKRDVVEEDEKDTGRRMILNFGHSIGHAIEQVYQYQTYTHGEAVAMGMAQITEHSERIGLSRPGTTARIQAALRGLGLPLRPAVWDKTALLAAMARDKKNTSDGLQLVVLPEIGRADVIRVGLDAVAAWL
ncbi:3-dehydroquinate synthase [Acetonema longum]|uniref:3-dehydroquinate synthase n=1 Tax=Acetonema longum DSM 6540 TaxID=1009370 RepID=F7NNK5_9FIRM|nr:3-dehydroquinate synthase [Acetonema longum]EGO62378.1 3-dehydroquinate synthase [Acetonema longum DSM 6540]